MTRDRLLVVLGAMLVTAAVVLALTYAVPPLAHPAPLESDRGF